MSAVLKSDYKQESLPNESQIKHQGYVLEYNNALGKIVEKYFNDLNSFNYYFAQNQNKINLAFYFFKPTNKSELLELIENNNNNNKDDLENIVKRSIN